MDTKPVSVILPFTPTYTQQVFTRFESLALDTDLPEMHGSCKPCTTDDIVSHHYLSVSYEQLMASMSSPLTPICLRRAIYRINNLLGSENDSSLYYDAYVMFNILYNVFSLHATET